MQKLGNLVPNILWKALCGTQKSFVCVFVFRFVFHVVLKLLFPVWLFVTPWTAAHQASLFITTPRACSNSCPSNWWCYLTISSYIPTSPFASIFPSIRVFPVSHLFTSGGPSIGVSASTSFLTMYIQDWFPLGWTGLISLQSKGLSRDFSSTTIQKHWFFGTQPSSWSMFHIHTWLLEKP